MPAARARCPRTQCGQDVRAPKGRRPRSGRPTPPPYDLQYRDGCDRPNQPPRHQISCGGMSPPGAPETPAGVAPACSSRSGRTRPPAPRAACPRPAGIECPSSPACTVDLVAAVEEHQRAVVGLRRAASCPPSRRLGRHRQRAGGVAELPGSREDVGEGVARRSRPGSVFRLPGGTETSR